MTQQKKGGDDDPNAVRKTMNVAAPPEIAWRVFTEKMGTWWPLAHYKIGSRRGKSGDVCSTMWASPNPSTSWSTRLPWRHGGSRTATFLLSRGYR